jgi:hypothetical protein
MRINVTTGVVLGAATVAALVYVSIGRRLSLLPSGDLVVWADWRQTSPTDEKIGILQSGQRYDVLRCEDVKSYIYPVVKVESGKIGFVVGGYPLIDEPLFGREGGPLTFTCP